jgi:predicted transposase YdaD
MEDVAMGDAPPELTPEDKKLAYEMFRTIYMTLKDMPEVKRMHEACCAARRQGEEEGLQKGMQNGRQEGRADAMRTLLAKACERAGLEQSELMGIIENADAIQLQAWVDRWMSGEKLEEVFTKGGP